MKKQQETSPVTACKPSRHPNELEERGVDSVGQLVQQEKCGKCARVVVSTHPTPSFSITEKSAIPIPSPDIVIISTNWRRRLK